jgi:hypothetical protein
MLGLSMGILRLCSLGFQLLQTFHMEILLHQRYVKRLIVVDSPLPLDQ